MNTYDYNISDIVNKYSRHVAMLSYTYTKNIADAEDIAQDVFLQLVKSNKKFENEEHTALSAIPAKINFEEVALPFILAKSKTPNETSKAPINAMTPTKLPPNTAPNPSIIANVAPSDAPDDIPRI